MTDWWNKEKNISVVVDNDSWILPFARVLVDWANANGHKAKLCRTHDDIAQNGVAFFLGCIKIAPSSILDMNKVNLVVHASDLPKGRGMSPWTWQVIEGLSKIPVCLLEASEEVDSGNIFYKHNIELNGDELVDEIRNLIGEKTVELCRLFLGEEKLPKSEEQVGSPTFYKKRNLEDSRINPKNTIEEQFNLLRVVDNEKYPAFFDYKGSRYSLKIDKMS